MCNMQDSKEKCSSYKYNNLSECIECDRPLKGGSYSSNRRDEINLNGKQVTVVMVGNSEDTAVNLIHKVMNGEYERD